MSCHQFGFASQTNDMESASVHGRELASVTTVNVLPSTQLLHPPSRNGTPDGSLPSFESGDVAFAQPVSTALHNRLRFLHPPLPAALSLALANKLPFRRATGLPCLVSIPV